jgi:hypothetical protein
MGRYRAVAGLEERGDDAIAPLLKKILPIFPSKAARKNEFTLPRMTSTSDFVKHELKGVSKCKGRKFGRTTQSPSTDILVTKRHRRDRCLSSIYFVFHILIPQGLH